MPRNTADSGFHPMKVQVKSGSYADSYYRGRAALPGDPFAKAKAIAPGVAPSPIHDLIFHGGKTVVDMQFQNLFVGDTQSWKQSDMDLINRAITTAMTDTRLNNVMVQYFPGQKISCTAAAPQILPGKKPAVVSEGDVVALVTRLLRDGKLGDGNFDGTIFNVILPSGSVLNTNVAATGSLAETGEPPSRKAAGGPMRDASSLNGLGGYHGSVHVKTPKGKNVTLYYSVNAFSEILPSGQENGISVFDKPWKNVVATLYHEMSEFRTDADVDDAIRAGNDPAGIGFLGWNSRRGEEIGDFPIVAAGNDLRRVFKEVKATGKTFSLPIQFQYSNAVHGPEGPITKPHS